MGAIDVMEITCGASGGSRWGYSCPRCFRRYAFKMLLVFCRHIGIIKIILDADPLAPTIE
jgi:hypothetical protein